MNNGLDAKNLIPGTTARIANLSTIRIAYSEGANNGPPLVLVHGTPGRRDDFNPVIKYLIDQFHLYVIDQRGHGFSSKTPSGYTATLFADDLGTFVDEVVGTSSLLWGHSFGGGIAIAAAARFPKLFIALVVEDPLLLEPTQLAPEGSELRNAFLGWRNLAQSNQTVEQIKIGLGSELDDLPGFDVHHFAEVLHQYDPNVAETLLGGRFFDCPAPRELIGEVQCPTLLMQADPAYGGIISDQLLETLLPLPDTWEHKRYTEAVHNISSVVAEITSSDAKDFFAKIISDRC